MTKKTTKAPAKKPTKAARPTPEQLEAGAKAVAAQEHGYFPRPGTSTPADALLVIVGGNGAAGRIIVNGHAYDSTTPRLMSRADFERLRAQYDLREVIPQ